MDSNPVGDALLTENDNNRFTPSRGQLAAMAAALLFLAGSVGYMVGVRGDTDPGAGSVDVGFLHDMISHHEQALQLSTIELNKGSEPEVRTFAREILQQQSYEIGVMEQQLEDWGFTRAARPGTAMAWMDHAVPVATMPGLASDDELTLLGERTGRDADALFIVLMQDHHLGGVHMADYAAKNAGDASVRALAARMAKVQQQEISEMSAARTRAQLSEKPAGWVPAVIPSVDDEDGGHGS